MCVLCTIEMNSYVLTNVCVQLVYGNKNHYINYGYDLVK